MDPGFRRDDIFIWAVAMTGNEITIHPFAPADRAAWDEMWSAYLRFYKTVLPPEVSEDTWSRFLALKHRAMSASSPKGRAARSASRMRSFIPAHGVRSPSAILRISM